MIGPLDYIFLACMFVIWGILLYHVVLSYSGYRFSLVAEREKARFDVTPAGPLPSVSVLIPAHNEALVIEQTLRAVARMDYPEDRLEILCLNDNSTDGTGKIARRMASSLGSHVRVIDVPREIGGRGKAVVLNYGMELASGEILAVYDADNTPERSALTYLVRKLVEDGKSCGAVIGKFRTRNRDHSLLTRFINLETIFYQWTTQAGRSYLYDLATIPGTNFVVWKELVREIGGWDPMALTEDTEMSIRIYLHGKHIRMAPYAVTWEEEPEKWKVWFRQRTRWARGNLYVIGKFFFPLLFRRKFKLFSDVLYLVLLYFLFLASVTTSLVIFFMGASGIARLSLNGPFDILWILAAILFVVEIGICLTTVPGEDRAKNLLFALLMYFTYSQAWLLVVMNSILQSLKGLFCGNTVFWDKTERMG